MKRIVCYLCFLIFLLTSCAISQHVPYDDMSMSFPSIEAKKITVAVWDQRAMVVDGSRKENFVGYMRSTTGIPYPMGTQSGRPFITEISRSIVDGFRSNGVDVCEISTTAHNKRNEILSMAKRAHNELCQIPNFEL